MSGRTHRPSATTRADAPTEGVTDGVTDGPTDFAWVESPSAVTPEEARSADLVSGASGLLRVFNVAGVLGAADVHVASLLGRLGGETDGRVLLAAALAVRGLRLGHVCVRLDEAASSTTNEADDVDLLASLPWPEPDAWVRAVGSSALTGVETSEQPADAGAPQSAHPLRLAGTSVYLDRYWRDELAVADSLLARSRPVDADPPGPVSTTGQHRSPGHGDPDLRRALAARLLPDDDQRRAAEAVLGRHLSIVAGGPGSGKTWTVARALAAVLEEARALGHPTPVVALCAPTGKAAARLGESLAAGIAAMASSAEAVHPAAPLWPEAAPARAHSTAEPHGTPQRRGTAGPTGPTELDGPTEAGGLGPQDRTEPQDGREPKRTPPPREAPRREEQLVSPETAAALGRVEPTTIHRLLGPLPGSNTRFRHDRHHPLAADVVVVDETSMVSLPLMARLLEAVRDDARLVLVGDPDQLSSVEAGAVLADIVGRPEERPDEQARGRGQRAERLGGEPEDGQAPPAVHVATRARPGGSGTSGRGDRLAPGIVALEGSRRFGSDIGALAEAIRNGNFTEVASLLRGARPDLTWVSAPDAPEVETLVTGAASAVLDAARRADAPAALDAVIRVGVLAATHHGPDGTVEWNERVRRWLGPVARPHTNDPWAVGQPLLVTRNDEALGLANGDLGVIVEGGDGGLSAAFRQRGEVVHVPPGRLEHVEMFYALTVHKSQGSQYDTVVVTLPSGPSRLLSRELLYTAVTRAQRRVVVVGPESSLRAGLERRVVRASGLAERLRADAAPGRDGPGERQVGTFSDGNA